MEDLARTSGRALRTCLWPLASS